mgnify:CR=1 FL=1
MSAPKKATYVFYSESENCIIDTCQDSIPPRSDINNNTLEEIRQSSPDAQYMKFERACQMMDEKNKLPVSEITEENFWNMLKIIPPMDWKQSNDHESFKMSERYSGTITNIYARIKNRYFTLQDSEFLKHDEIIKRCEQYKATH